MILTVGLTGGIASGKSSVLSILRSLGCQTVDADKLVSELYRPGEAGHRALVAAYGDEILASDGEVDRKKLSAAALSTPEGAKRLNSLIHPLVIERQQALASAAAREPGDRLFVVEATLLLESGGRARFEKIVVVDLPVELQLARAIGRGVPRQEAELRMARQMSRQERIAQADYVILNDGDRATLELRTAEVHRLLLDDLRNKNARA